MKWETHNVVLVQYLVLYLRLVRRLFTASSQCGIVLSNFCFYHLIMGIVYKMVQETHTKKAGAIGYRCRIACSVLRGYIWHRMLYNTVHAIQQRCRLDIQPRACYSTLASISHTTHLMLFDIPNLGNQKHFWLPKVGRHH